MDNITRGNIKEEGRAGLLYAYDSSHRYTSAEEAKTGEKYTCPICNCSMHVTTTKSGKKIFARDPKRPHTDPICITIEQKGKIHTFTKLDPQKFITSLCQIAPRKAGPGVPPPPGGPNPGPDVPHPLVGNEDDLEEKSFSSLKQIAEAGIDHLDPDDRQGQYKVSDFIMTYKYASRFFSNPTFELSERIIYARFAWEDYETNSLIFTLFTREKASVKFRLVFLNKKDFLEWRNKFGKWGEDEKGKAKFIKHHEKQEVLIASDNWVKLEDDCHRCCNGNKEYCKSCYGMYQATFINKKQLYLIPADH